MRVLLALALLASPVAAGISSTPQAEAATAVQVDGGTGKGPVGWDTYRRLDRAGELRSGVQTRQFSSYDRGGGNNDGFDGAYSCLRQSDAGCVIAERSGAGEVQSIWFTRFGPTGGGDITDTGWIRIELDGRTVLDAKAQDVVTGKLGAPFEWPLIGNGDDTAGGAVIKVPMPYRESMRITVQNNPLFYHVSYRTFDDATGVKTFDPADKALDVLNTLRGFGLRDPKPAAPGTRTQSAGVVVAPGGKARVATVSGSGRLTALRVKLPQVVHSPRARDDGRAYQGGSSFTVNVAPGNQGVRVTKRFDPMIGNQRSRLLADGQPAGEWTSGPAQPSGRWVDQAIEIPAALTAGKSTLKLTNEFVSSDLDVNEFRYDIASKVGGQWVRTDVLDLGQGHPGEEKAHGYVIDRQSWVGERIARYPVDPADLQKSDAVLNDTRVRITFDGHTTVDSPIGEFFGSGLGEYDTRTLLFGMDAGQDGWYQAWWPMPFGKSATVELVNTGSVPVTGGTVEVSSVSDLAARPSLATGRIGYFNATSKRAETTSGRDWPFVDVQGTGVYYGATHSMRGLIPGGNRRNYLEGDERVYVDGSPSPAWSGTGTEDFYESGWYFRDGTTYAMPTAGNPAYELDGDGCRYDCTGTYRLLVGDAVPFGSSLRFGIEHGPAANEPGDYSSTAYWYGQPDYQLERTDRLDLADPESVKAHDYRGPAAGAALTSTFEGDDDDVPVTHAVASGNQPADFRLSVEDDNRGVRLNRLGDQREAFQAADVYVDGRLAGRWTQPLGNTHSRWLEDSFDLPQPLTSGRHKLSIRLVPVAGAPAWSAATYEAVSRVEPFTDQRAPSQVTGLTATGGESNEILLSWAAASDDVGVKSYQVYAAGPGGTEKLIGTTAVPGFRHRGLGLRETWTYQVRAVDGAGHLGAFSGRASGTTGSTLLIEAETLLPPVSADAPVEAQGNCCGVVWSNNQHLWFRADSAGDKVTVRFTVPATGTYDASWVLTKAPDYGIVQLAVDGAALGDPFDGYEPGRVLIAPPLTGTLQLTAGTHELTMTVTGKNDASTGFLAGLDLLKLKLT